MIRDWNQLSTTDFNDIDRKTTMVIMPFGATEQHGPHLPVGTDYFLVNDILHRLKQRITTQLEALVLPTLWSTKSNEHAGTMGTIFISATTMIMMVNEIARCVHVSGFQKLVMMNWHGGNTDIVGVLGRDIHQNYGLTVCIIDVVRAFIQPADNQEKVKKLELHGGQYETSLMLGCHPELVKPGPYMSIGSDYQSGKPARSFINFHLIGPAGAPGLIPWLTSDLSDDGVIGNPIGSSAEIGTQNIDAQVEKTEAILREFSRFDYQT
jgi:creatinine amidohydrolase